jgi:hypothetical protein
MTPQSTFMILAPVAEGQEESLRALLATMNSAPGLADPANALVPFGQFDRLHVARFAILEAETGADVGVYGITPTAFAASLALLGDCDGPADTFLRELTDGAGPGLRRIFAHVQGFAADTDLLPWMQQHSHAPAATYVNWIGRTVAHIREDAALREALVVHLRQVEPQLRGQPSLAICKHLVEFVDGERKAGRLALTPEAATPVAWQLRNALHLIGVPLVLLALLPFLLVASPFLVWRLRAHEKSDPEIAPPVAPARLRELATSEDQDVTNQFSAFGDSKPGIFRHCALLLFLWVLDYSARHIYKRGYLTRVQTIHFARWVLLDGDRRLFFASNYDGSLDSYMDDFINKVAWGINLVFSNGIGFPRTSWLLCGGAKSEQTYGRYLHRHQLPTAVWYKAYRGLTVADLNRNTRIRQGVDQRTMSDREARQWLSLL